ncbi:hypothetical protein D0T84_02485 [Dysgonomonas sp. 521]|nr:hypothetical protein [Dysgonomonas sp. 521]
MNFQAFALMSKTCHSVSGMESPKARLDYKGMRVKPTMATTLFLLLRQPYVILNRLFFSIKDLEPV